MGLGQRRGLRRRDGGRPRLTSPEIVLALEDFNRQALHARKLSLIHPQTGAEAGWKAPLPQDMETLLHALRADAGMAEEGWDDDEDWDDDDECEVFYIKE